MNEAPRLSIVAATRARVTLATRFIESIARTASEPNLIDVTFVVDDDDDASLVALPRLCGTGVPVRVVIAPRGSTMGELNRLGAAAAMGRWIFLTNDDVVVRTPGWDAALRRVVSSLPDPFFLLHVNDGFFRHRLSVFPILSREFCQLAGGACPSDFARYRIDDHIHALFRLLGRGLGHPRVLYFPFIEFRHLNVASGPRGERFYAPDPRWVLADTERYERLRSDRIAIAERVRSALGAPPVDWSARISDLSQPSFASRSESRFVYEPASLSTLFPALGIRALNSLSRRAAVRKAYWRVANFWRQSLGRSHAATAAG